MHYAVVSAASAGLSISHQHGADLIRVGEAIRKSVQAVYEPVHPLNSGIRGVSTMQFTEPLAIVAATGGITTTDDDDDEEAHKVKTEGKA